MIRRYGLALLLVCPALLCGQEQSEPAGNVLTLDQAIALALRNNRLVSNAALDVEKSRIDLSIMRTRRLPIFDMSLYASQLLTPVSFEFKEGVFGTFPSIGPVPGRDTKIVTPRRPNELVLANATQPLSQLYKIGLGMKLTDLSLEIAKERLRLERQSTLNGIKRLYYGLLQSESGLRATEEAINLYRELDRVVAENLAQRTALKADSLEVKTRLAKAEYDALTLRQGLATQKEQLNNLLGRDINTEFSISPISESPSAAPNLDAARTRALNERPEVKEARLKLQQTEYDRRLKKAEYIPDVSMRFTYLSPFSIEVLPKNIASAGIYVTWEPFDWGRKTLEMKQKTKTMEQAKNGLREAENQVLIEVNARFRKLEESRSLLHLTQLAQETARERLRVATNKYKEHAVQLKDVLEAETQLSQANHEYQQGLLLFWTAQADFEKALGEE